MKIKFGFEFDAGVFQIPGEDKIIGKGVFPLVSHLTDPQERFFEEAETLQMVEEIHCWMKSLGLSKKSFLSLARDSIQANTVGWWVPRVAERGYTATILYYKFVVIFWILDDFLEHNLDNPNESARDDSNFCVFLYSQFESIWNSPENISTSALQNNSSCLLIQMIIAAWRSLTLDLKANVPSYIKHQPFINAVHCYLSTFSWSDQTNRKIPSSEFTFRIVRRNFIFVDGMWEFGAAISGVSISPRVREHRYFPQMYGALCDIGSFSNDVMSLQKELIAGESCNILLVKVKQGATALEAMNETLRTIWDSCFEAMKLAELLIETFPDEPQLSSYLQMGMDLINGNAPVHSKMQRYINFSGRIISLPEFPNLDEQARYTFKNLLKTGSPS